MSPRATRRCPYRDCDLTTPCPEHQKPWASSNRRATLPSGWARIRAAVLVRDPTCQLAYPGLCERVSTEVDHAGDSDDHREHMLRGVCSPCHRRRTQEQSAAARRN